MKMKVKFDKASLVGFFANNGEKIVFGIVVLFFFMFVWNAFTCERFEKQPEDLERAAASARDHIANSPTKIDREVEDYTKKIKEISDPIVVTPYQLARVWEPSVFPPLRKRGEPVLFPVESLVATPGHGKLNDTNMTGGGGMPGGMGGNALIESDEPEGKRWVVLTGLVNMEKYMKSYKDCFEDVAFKQQTDYPQFYTYRVERAEITEENQDPSTLVWQRPYTGRMEDYILKYAGNTGGGGSANEQTYPQHINPTLIFPLPPRVDRDWGEEVLHSPEIPKIDPSMINQMGGFPMGTEPAADPDQVNPQNGNDDDTPDVPTGMGVGMGGGMGMGMGMPGGEMGMGMGMPGGGMGRYGAQRGMMGAGVAGTVQKEISPYVLFRFFDFNVEPGKRYRYRVQLYLINPNHGVAERYLEPEIAAKTQDPKQWGQFITTNWSEPSDVINMPLDDSLLIAEVSKPTRVDSEPTGKVTAIHWDHDRGIEMFNEFEVTRGMVVNIYDQDVPANALLGQPGMGPMGGEMPPAEDQRDARRGGQARNNRTPQQQQQKIDYVTEMLVMDLKGGDRLPGRNLGLTQPSSMLLFSPNGSMIVRSSVKDKEELEEMKNPSRGGTGMMRGMGMPGMMPGMMPGGPGRGGGEMMPNIPGSLLMQ